jgi:DNA-binding CsgD family transcriptional regulator
MTETLVDGIYECAFAPEFWPDILDELAKIADARGGHVTAVSAKGISSKCSACLQPMVDRAVAGNYAVRSKRIPLILSARHAGFLREQDFFTEEEMLTDPLRREMLGPDWPQAAGFGAATAIPLPTGDTITFGFERNRDRGLMDAAAVDRLDAMRPHLARSALFSARLQLQQARAAAETLALIGLPALVFDERGKVLAANGLIEALTDTLRWRAQDRVSLKDVNADALFRQSIETIQIESVGLTRSFAIRGGEGRATMVAHVIPVRRSARDIFVRCAAVLALTPVTLPQAPPVELVQSLFDLTPTEARVARDLTAGQTVEEIASGGSISVTTVRSHVRGLLEKTGCRRQVEAIALLGGISIVKA